MPTVYNTKLQSLFIAVFLSISW